MKFFWLVGALGIASGCDDDPPPNVTVHVLGETLDDAGLPVAGLAVAFMSPDGETTIAITDDDGNARANIVAGTTVHAARVRDGTLYGDIYTVFGVEPESSIVLGSQPVASGAQAGNLIIEHPVFEGDGNATYHYRLFMECTTQGASDGTTLVAEIRAQGCSADPRTAYLMVADDLTGEVVASMAIPSVPLVPGTIVAPGPWQPPTMHVATLSGLGAVSEAYVNWNYTDLHGWTQAFGAVTDGAAVLSVPGPPGSSTRVVSVLQGPALHTQYVLETGTASYALDGSDLLPFVNGGQFLSASRTATWTTTAGGARAVATRATLWVTGPDAIHYSWSVYMPGQANQLVLPGALPPEIGVDVATASLMFDTVFLIETDDDYAGLLGDLDLFDGDELPFGDYRPTARILISGGFLGTADVEL